MGRALGEHFDEGEAAVLDLQLERLLDRLAGARALLRVVERDALDVDRAVEAADHLGHPQGFAFEDAAAAGEVAVTWPGREVGAICPPVMP